MSKRIQRRKRALPTEEVSAILHQGTSRVSAPSGDDDYPYTIPISYMFDSTKLYFHCAEGDHKPGATQRSSRASFCAIGQDQIVLERHTTYFRSVITSGQIRIIQDEEEKQAAIEESAKKYSPGEDAAGRRKEIDWEWKTLYMLEMCIGRMTGKEAIELVKKRWESN